MSEPIYIYEIPIVPQDYFWGWQQISSMDENLEVICLKHSCSIAKTMREALGFLKKTFFSYLKENNIVSQDEMFPTFFNSAYATAILGAQYVIGVETKTRGAVLASYSHIDKVINAVYPMQKYTKTEIKAEIKITSTKILQQKQDVEKMDAPWTV